MANKISICIPAFNEGGKLNGLFQSLSDSDMGEFDYEILLCDSESRDETYEIFMKWSRTLNLQFLTTKNANTSQNLNLGLQSATGNIFCRIDARARVSNNYFRVGISFLESLEGKYCAIGPMVSIIPQSNNFFSDYFAKFFLSPFLMGPSKYKKSFFYKNFQGDVDSIYLGFFWTKDLLSIKGFDENLERKQDIDLFKRLRGKTKKNLFISNQLKATYILKHDTFLELAKRSYIQGLFASLHYKTIRLGHILPFVIFLLFLIITFTSPLTGLLLIIFYNAMCIIFGFLEKPKLLSIPLSIVIFPTIHFLYVLGNIKGIFKKII